MRECTNLWARCLISLHFCCFLQNLTATGDSHDIEENIENDAINPSNER